MKKFYVYNNNFINIRLYRFMGTCWKHMITLSYIIVTSEEKSYLKSCKTLIEEWGQLCKLHKEKSEPEAKLEEKVGQLKRKEIHIE